MEIIILHIYKSNLGPSNSDGSNTMDGSNLFESPANFPYIFKLKKVKLEKNIAIPCTSANDKL